MTLYADSTRQADELWLETLGKLFYDSDCIVAGATLVSNCKGT